MKDFHVQNFESTIRVLRTAEEGDTEFSRGMAAGMRFAATLIQSDLNSCERYDEYMKDFEK